MRKKSHEKMKRKDRNYHNIFSHIRKAESKSNVVTSKRITMPPNFLTLNVISETARKNDSGSGTSFKKVENVYDIFDDEPMPNLRRSARLNNKKNRIHKPILEDNSLSNYPGENSFYETPQETSTKEAKRKCKSLFKEINRRYAEIVSAESNNLNFNKDTCNDLFIKNLSQNSCSTVHNYFNGDLALWDVKNNQKIKPPNFFYGINEQNNIFQDNLLFQQTFCPKKFRKYVANADFSASLSNQLLGKVEYFKEQVLDECKSKINIKIHSINFILQGNRPQLSHFTSQFQYVKENEPGPCDFTFNQLPHNKWVFETPNKQGVVKNNIVKRTIKPAFIYKNNNNLVTNIMELDPEDITIDLTKFNFQEPLSQKVPNMPEPFGCFNQVSVRFNAGQNSIFDLNQPSTFASSFEFFPSQQSHTMSQRSSFEFRPNLPGGNFFL